MVTNLIRSTATKVGDNFNSQLNELKDSIFPRKIEELGDGFFVDNPAGNRIIFPLSMRNETAASRPMISFTIEFERDKPPSTIYFPCPGGIAFNDQGNYGTVELGALGALAGDIADVASAGSLKEAGEMIATKIKDKASVGGVKNLIIEQAMEAASGTSFAGVDVGGVAKFATKRVQNPRVNTLFESNSMRTFSFNFKLIASSAQEYQVIDAIHTLFQAAIYAQPVKGSINSLHFPPTTEVRFLFKGKENPNIPKIHKTYLTGMSSTYNSSANSWRTNGEPLEADFSLNFQEIRVLTRDDIEELRKDSPDRNRGARGNFDRIGKEVNEKVNKATEEVKALNDLGRENIANTGSAGTGNALFDNLIEFGDRFNNFLTR